MTSRMRQNPCKDCGQRLPGYDHLLHAVSKTNANVLADVIDRVAAKGFTWGDPSKI